MTFRFRRSARLGPLRFNFSKGGLSSFSVGGRGASLNLPVNRHGGPRTTVGLPGSGLSWSMEHDPGDAAGLPNSRRLRPGQLEQLQRSCLGLLKDKIFSPGSAAHQLWDQSLVTRLLGDGRLGARDAGLLAVIETPNAMEAYLLRARSEDDTRRRANRCVAAAQKGMALAADRGWLRT